MARKKKYDYFEAFVKITTYAEEYATKLVNFLEDHYDAKKGTGHMPPKKTLEALSSLHEIEDAADEIVAEVTSKLAAEFMTPIDREDIMLLVNELDDVVDDLDNVLQRIYMYDLTLVTGELIDMAHVVLKSTEALKTATHRLANYKKAKSIKEQIKRISELEDEGDQTYIRSVHTMYKRAVAEEYDNPLVVVGLAGVMQALENCCDACETAGDTIVLVVMKNN